ncbi:hypothetical protein SBOR_5031 [Sclerotinia borealis F-4128]|uniref:Uncharacterized protein n=1 Tax=Sclerotinia borealis (strain F-4128) TaxID=1432307 RepID=W9CJB1_SCLBF|nr:hypothetical protein SBOR_5031 [Sclerotinia borealis F-4128]
MVKLDFYDFRKAVSKIATDDLFTNWEEYLAMAERDYKLYGKAKIELKIEISTQLCKEQWPREESAQSKPPKQLLDDSNTHIKVLAQSTNEPRNMHIERVSPPVPANRNAHDEATAPISRQSGNSDVELIRPRNTSYTATPSSRLATNVSVSPFVSNGESSANTYSVTLPVSEVNIPLHGRVLKQKNCFQHCANVAIPYSDLDGPRWSNYRLDLTSVVNLQYCQLQLKRVTCAQSSESDKLRTKYCIIWPTYKPKFQTPAMLEEVQYVARFLHLLQGQEHFPRAENICDRYKQFEKAHPRHGAIFTKVGRRSLSKGGYVGNKSRKRPRGDEGNEQDRSGTYSN